MEQTPHSSRRLLVVGLAAILGLILVIALVAYLLVGTTKKAAPATVSKTATRVASKTEVNQSLSDLNTTLKQANADQAAAKAAITDGENQAEVSN